MQIRLESSRANKTGSVLFITLVLAGLLGTALGSYLYWVRSQNLLTTESHAWNGALVVAEAGVEEALAQLNTKFGTNGNFAANGWGVSGGIYGPPDGGTPRVLRVGSVTNGSYSAIITRDATTGYPIVYSTGYTTVPLVGRLITRVVKVETTTTPAFAGAMAALNNITFKGTQIAIDSYDSMDPLHSTNFMYNPATRKAGGDVASISGVVSVGNANVNGKVRTGPNGSYNIGPTGFVGDLGWTGPGLQPGWYANDFNADFKDAALPDGFSGIPPVGDGTNLFVLLGMDYTINGDLSMKAKETMVVRGNARLFVTGNVLMQGQAAINIEDGASLEIYVAGPSATFIQVNTLGNANSYRYFGLPTNTSLTWGGNATYVGTVYAPQAAFDCGGGGSTVYDYQGACVVKSVNLNGHFNFHYDENLKRRGPMAGFQMKSWREL